MASARPKPWRFAWEQVIEGAVRRKEIKPTTHHVLLALARMIRSHDPRRVNVSYPELGRQIGRDRHTVGQAIEEAEKAGLLEIVWKGRNVGRYGGLMTRLRLLDPAEEIGSPPPPPSPELGQLFGWRE